MAQNIHFPVPGNCRLPERRKGARNFHRMMQKPLAALLPGGGY